MKPLTSDWRAYKAWFGKRQPDHDWDTWSMAFFAGCSHVRKETRRCVSFVRMLARKPCERVFGIRCGCRDKGSRLPADAWCLPCVARQILAPTKKKGKKR